MIRIRIIIIIIIRIKIMIMMLIMIMLFPSNAHFHSADQVGWPAKTALDGAAMPRCGCARPQADVCLFKSGSRLTASKILLGHSARHEHCCA